MGIDPQVKSTADIVARLRGLAVFVDKHNISDPFALREAADRLTEIEAEKATLARLYDELRDERDRFVASVRALQVPPITRQP